MRPAVPLAIVAFLLFGASTARTGGQDDSRPSEPVVPPGFFGTYQPPIELKWDEYKEPSNLSQEANWNRLFQEELGIDLADVPNSAVPDVFTFEGESKLIDFNLLASAGKLADMTDIWSHYASPLNKEVTGDTTFLNNLKYDTRLMAIPGSALGFDSYSYLWIRRDWLNNLGLNGPDTLEDLLNIARAFTHEDPDKDGHRDTFAMILDKSLWYRSEGFFWSFGAYPDTWLRQRQHDGRSTLIYGALQPQVKEALMALRDMYEDGQLDPDWILKGHTEAAKAFAENAVGIAYGGHWSPFDFLAGWDSDSPPVWRVYPPPTREGTIAIGEIESDVRRIYAVRKDFAFPESLIKVMNLYWDKLYGETGDYEYWRGNQRVESIEGPGEITAPHPWINARSYVELQDVFSGWRRPESLSGVSLDYYNNITNNPDLSQRWAWRTMFVDPVSSPFANLALVQQEDRVYVDKFTGLLTPLMREGWDQLQELKLKVFSEIITGTRPLRDFEQFVRLWWERGGRKITREVNEFYSQL